MNRAAVGALLLGVALVLLPVAVRNVAVGGTLVLTTAQFGPNFYIGNNPSATGGYVPLRVGRGSPEYERQDAVALAEQTTGRTLTPSEVSAFWSAQAIDFITSQPEQWLRLMGRKLLLLVNSVEMVDSESQDSYAEWSTVLRVGSRVGHFGVLIPLAAFGMWAAWPGRRRLWIVYAILATYAGTVVLFYVFARYRFPLVPAMWLFAAAGLVHGPARLRALSASGRMIAGAVVALLVLVTNWPLLSRAQMQAATETNLGAELYEQGRYHDAVGHYERAIRFDPSHAPAYNNLGVALAAQDQIPRAIDSYERAIALRSDFADAHYNLGNALLAGGRPAEAGAHFAEARKLLPSNAEVHNNLGLAMMADGRVEQAVAEFRSALAADPGSVIARRNLADALAARGQFDEAVSHLRRAVELRDDPALRYDLGSILLEGGRAAEAELHLRAAAAGRPGWAEAHNNLGIALGSLGRVDEAIDQFRRALAVRQDFGDARRNLAMAEEARAGVRPPSSPASSPHAPR